VQPIRCRPFRLSVPLSLYHPSVFIPRPSNIESKALVRRVDQRGSRHPLVPELRTACGIGALRPCLSLTTGTAKIINTQYIDTQEQACAGTGRLRRAPDEGAPFSSRDRRPTGRHLSVHKHLRSGFRQCLHARNPADRGPRSPCYNEVEHVKYAYRYTPQRLAAQCPSRDRKSENLHLRLARYRPSEMIAAISTCRTRFLGSMEWPPRN
jgi:hypothetical protein